jgi:acetylornithine deacetylase
MHVFELTRALIDIESITANEERIGEYLLHLLGELCRNSAGQVERMDVEPHRFNVLACWGQPVVTLSTHLDTVPPFFPSREDDDFIWGRGACDVKGIIAAMIGAVERLLDEGQRNIALLFVVGEEKNSAGAYAAARQNRGSRFLINGEPTENRLALGSKGALRFDVVTEGRMAHSAYPELGESAIDKLLEALGRLRQLKLPVDEVLGESTLNIGTLAGGRAPNVIADRAQAEVMFRLIDDGASIRTDVQQALDGLATLRESICVPAVRLGSLPGFETCIVKYTTDIPAFGDAWGMPFLIGPGTIHVAHTDQERVPKKQLLDAVGLYARLARQLLNE